MVPDTTMAIDGVKDPYINASIIEYLYYLRVK
jgi:cytochrome c2